MENSDTKKSKNDEQYVMLNMMIKIVMKKDRQ